MTSKLEMSFGILVDPVSDDDLFLGLFSLTLKDEVKCTGDMVQIDPDTKCTYLVKVGDVSGSWDSW